MLVTLPLAGLAVGAVTVVATALPGQPGVQRAAAALGSALVLFAGVATGRQVAACAARKRGQPGQHWQMTAPLAATSPRFGDASEQDTAAVLTEIPAPAGLPLGAPALL